MGENENGKKMKEKKKDPPKTWNGMGWNGKLGTKIGKNWKITNELRTSTFGANVWDKYSVYFCSFSCLLFE